jgi:putative Holliday junction resolvase
VLQKRFISIDYGKKRIGVAVSDPLNLTARGIDTLNNDETFLQKFSKIISEFNPQAIVVGMPYMPSGDVGERAKEVIKFSNFIKDKFSIPIILWDERYTSKVAVDTMIKSGVKKKKRARKENIDRIAAAILLQEYLDSLSSENRWSDESNRI